MTAELYFNYIIRVERKYANSNIKKYINNSHLRQLMRALRNYTAHVGELELTLKMIFLSSHVITNKQQVILKDIDGFISDLENQIREKIKNKKKHSFDSMALEFANQIKNEFIIEDLFVEYMILLNKTYENIIRSILIKEKSELLTFWKKFYEYEKPGLVLSMNQQRHFQYLLNKI